MNEPMERSRKFCPAYFADPSFQENTLTQKAWKRAGSQELIATWMVQTLRIWLSLKQGSYCSCYAFLKITWHLGP
jgi:hypothetical protein